MKVYNALEDAGARPNTGAVVSAFTKFLQTYARRRDQAVSCIKCISSKYKMYSKSTLFENRVEYPEFPTGSCRDYMTTCMQ
jgi:hypothetical protein